MPPIKFGTDGWRGIIDKDFSEVNVKLATRAIADYFTNSNKKTIVIGYDGRRKASDFARISAEIMANNGIKVYLVDKPCPTPAAGWSIVAKHADGGIMFTASHNPPEFLGLKFMTDEAMVAPQEVTDEFMMRQKNLENIKNEDIKVKNEIEIFDPKPAYLEKIGELTEIQKIKNAGLRVLVNPMSGSGAGYLSNLLSSGKIQIETINDEIDPNFGNITPEPIVEKNVTDALAKMKKGNFDVCLSCDGDADRIGLIDERGRMLSSLETFLLQAYYLVVLKKQRGPIVETLSNTVMVKNLCQKYGLENIETKVGFKYVGEKMKESEAILGGEESGGSTIKGYILIRDAQLMNLVMLDLMIEMKKPLSKILAIAKDEAGGGFEFKREDVHFDYDKYEKIRKEKAQELIKNPPKEVLGEKVVKVRTDDGLKLYLEDGSWLLIRFSGTEPVLRVYAEAKTMNKVDEFIQYVKDLFKV